MNTDPNQKLDGDSLDALVQRLREHAEYIKHGWQEYRYATDIETAVALIEELKTYRAGGATEEILRRLDEQVERLREGCISRPWLDAMREHNLYLVPAACDRWYVGNWDTDWEHRDSDNMGRLGMFADTLENAIKMWLMHRMAPDPYAAFFEWCDANGFRDVGSGCAKDMAHPRFDEAIAAYAKRRKEAR